jgi:hypothetical protein
MDGLIRVIVCIMVLWPGPVPRDQPDPEPVVEVRAKARKAVALTGQATWYRWRPGESAAGPALRRALGPSWRGKVIEVCASGRCVRTRLTDWCACKGRRVVDLDVRSFERLASPSRGVIEVEVKW